jgi:hypothetical protein
MSSTNPSRCGLPGCAAAVADAGPRGAPRRYCSAEHRRLHRTPMRQEPEDLPLDVDPRPRVRARWRRGLVVAVGAAAVGAAGWAVAAEPPAAALSVERLEIPVVDPDAGWLARARATLTSIDEQLDLIAQVERAWTGSDAAARSADALPLPVRALFERRTLLEQQGAALRSQIATEEALDRAAGALAATEEQLAALDAAPEPGEAAVRKALRNQRALLTQVRDAQVAELRRLDAAVAAARSSPLPDASDRTSPIALSVLAIATGASAG